MADTFLGEIRAFAFQFAPRGWALCNGQIMQISQNQALFALLGTTFGGNGVQTFGLPDLRGRIAMGIGPTSVWGQVQGTETISLTSAQIPAHNHAVNANNNGTVSATNVPAPNVILGSGSTTQASNPAVNIYGTVAPNVQLNLTITGQSQPHENRMPSLVINYCIALQGIFPSRN
jgi:microcystin-dependent protein